MSTLVIHPKDRSTVFLKPIYSGLPNVTLVDGGGTRRQLEALIEEHDQVMMMGHGSPGGLLAVGQFNRRFAIDRSFADVLAEKDNSVFIWCNADKYVESERLRGFYTGMFISEVWESYMMGVTDVDEYDIVESNQTFVDAIRGHKTPRMMHAAANHKYGKLAKINPVAQYNHERLYLAA